MARPVSRRTLATKVFEQLRDDIVCGAYPPGSSLPTEHELCEAMGVNRSSIREALQRLKQMRLLEVRQGSGSVVLDWQQHAGFELLGDLIAPARRLDPIVLRSVLEFRKVVVLEMARLAALRATPEQHRQLAEIVDRIEACAEGDGTALQDLDVEFHDTLVRCCESPAYVLVFNSVKAIYADWRAIFTVIFTDQPAARALYRPLVDAIVARDAAGAVELVRQQTHERDRAFWGAAALLAGSLAPGDEGGRP